VSTWVVFMGAYLLLLGQVTAVTVVHWVIDRVSF
jgi:hypothetical protein